MNKSFLWVFKALPLLSVSCLLGAQKNSQLDEFNERLTALEMQKPLPPSASPAADKGWNLFTIGEVLVWQAHQNGVPVAIKTQNTMGHVNPLNLLQNASVKNIKYDWDAGFRFGIGYDWPRDQIDLSLTWLRFFTHGRRHLVAGSGEQLYPVQLHPLDGKGSAPNQVTTPTMAFSKAESHWYAHLNQLDLDMGRAFYVGKWFNVRPHFGLRTTWIQQQLSVGYVGNLYKSGGKPGDDYDMKNKSQWWGIGPEAGLDINLGLGRGFSLCGDIGGAIEWGFHSLSRQEIDATIANTGANPTLVSVHDNFRQSRPILDIQLGVRWEHGFSANRYHLSLESGWEQHVYYSQNQSAYFVNDAAIATNITNHGDLTYQGWNFAIRLDY